MVGGFLERCTSSAACKLALPAYAVGSGFALWFLWCPCFC